MNSNAVTASYRENKLILTTKGKKHDQVNHSGLCISGWTKRLKSHDLYRLGAYSNWAERNHITKGKKHDPVKHLGLRISDWTKRLKSQQ